MASASGNQHDDGTVSDEYCTIEASVVTGFEESARGEAKEKFGTDVKAARGKITWRVPLSRVKDVMKMGSIDNCRVVMHTVPHFKFTDQYNSLARLQYMVRDVDWDSGLKAWRSFYDFAYPIESKPEFIPSLEDLLDVVIITGQPQPKDTEDKRNEKGGRGKKKEKKRSKRRNEENDKGRKLKEGVSTGIDESGPAEGMLELANEDVLQEDSSELQASCGELNVNEKGDAKTLSDDNDSLKSSDINPDSKESNVTALDNEQPDDRRNSFSVSGELAKSDQGLTTKPSFYEPKRVIIKRAVPGAAEPEIEIKVIPEPTVFPVEVTDSDYRNLEPMDVDLANLSLNESLTSRAKNSHQDDNKHSNSEKLHEQESSVQDLELVRAAESDRCEKNLEVLEAGYDSNGNVQKVPASANISSLRHSLSASEFASTVIKRLTSPPQSPQKDFTQGSRSPESATCVTPPPTPIYSTVDPFSQRLSVVNGKSPSLLENESKTELLSENLPETEGDSSVDPPSFSTDLNLPCLGNNSVEVNVSSLLVMVEPNGIKSPSVVKEISSVNDASEKGPGNRDDPMGSVLTENTVQKNRVKRERDPSKPTFRVTCNRVGDNHLFDSTSAAASFGSAVITYFNWSVDLKNFDIEIHLNIDNEEVTVSLALTKTSLHNRNLVAFGPTTLRATVCYNMLRLCHIKNGDFICDPMCGTAAIPIEGALNWHNCFHFGGDCHEKAIDRALQNITAVQAKMKEENKGSLKLDTVQWDIKHFPLRDKCVDVFVSDLPFGHRLGSKTINRTLYPCLLSEMSRTARAGARACLLTEDKTNLIKTIQALNKYWQRRLVLNINLGGLSAFVFLLVRTTSAMAPTMGNWHKEQQHQPGEMAEGGKKASEGNSAASSGLQDGGCATEVPTHVAAQSEA